MSKPPLTKHDTKQIESLASESEIDPEYIKRSIELNNIDDAFRERIPPEKPTEQQSRLGWLLTVTKLFFASFFGTRDVYISEGVVTDITSQEPSEHITIKYQPNIPDADWFTQGVSARSRTLYLENEQDREKLQRLLRYLDLPEQKPSALLGHQIPLDSPPSIHGLQTRIDYPPNAAGSRWQYRWKRTLRKLNLSRPKPDEISVKITLLLTIGLTAVTTLIAETTSIPFYTFLTTGLPFRETSFLFTGSLLVSIFAFLVYLTVGAAKFHSNISELIFD